MGKTKTQKYTYTDDVEGVADGDRSGKRKPSSKRPESRRGLSRGARRELQRQRARRRKTISRFFITGGISLGAALLVIGIVVSGGLLTGPSRELLGVNTGGHIALDPDDGRLHVGSPSEIVHGESGVYSVVPATSGDHYNAPRVILPNGELVSGPAAWGTYDFHLPDEVLVHNLEHGGIGLHYDPLSCPDNDCESLVDQLKEFPPGSHSQFIISPYNGLEAATGFPIAITAWLHHQYFNEVDQEAFELFIEEYRDRAPESVPGNQFQHPG